MIIARIESAMIARLKAASDLGVLGYTLSDVTTLPSDLDERLAEYVQTFPTAWVVFGGWPNAENMGGGEAAVVASFHVVVAAANLRNEKAQRHGVASAGEVGSYQMAMDVIGLLMGQDFGLDMGPLLLGACSPLYNGALQDKRRASLFAVKFDTRLVINPLAPEVLTVQPAADFTTFAVGWDRPGGDPDPLADIVNLPQEP
ncbi:phage protein Gp37 [Reyranella sp.]|uniref:phage protein Gp37 n=1 Tax=Reyranella sp. TaxID=1929291 RepID=UPI00272F2934|nr:phage protein Gp37 [Reyranella sp.]MDP2373167.1 DUF1834 family protein [Reyranella sp.]